MTDPLIRFVIKDLSETSGYREGFFQEAYRLRRAYALLPEDHRQLDDLLKWFGKNLDEPKRFNSSKSKGWWRRDTRGICWFKVKSIEHVSKAQQMASLMRRNGIEVFELRTARPGVLVFEDPHQVVAEPFNDVAGIR